MGCKVIAVALALTFIVIAVGMVVAQDPLDPHGDGVDMPPNCFTCHVLHKYLGELGPGPSLTRADFINNLCRSCHNDSGGTATNAETHIQPSSLSEPDPITCTICHNPHMPEGSNISLVREHIETFNSGVKNVQFLTDTDDITGYGEGVCASCHTQTKYHRNYGLLFGVDWSAQIQDDLDNDILPQIFLDKFQEAGIALPDPVGYSCSILL